MAYDDLDNPAARMHAFLTAIRTYDPKLDVQRATTRALKLPEDTTLPVLMPYLATVILWPDQAVKEINDLPDVDHDLLTEWHPRVVQALAFIGHTTAQIDQVTARFNGDDLIHLKFAARTLARLVPEPTLIADNLPHLVELIQELIKEVIEDTGLSENARHFLVTRLQEVEAMLQHFRIVGYEGVEDAVDKLVAGYFRRADVQTPERRSKLDRLMSALREAFNYSERGVALANGAFKAIESTQNMIGR